MTTTASMRRCNSWGPPRPTASGNWSFTLAAPLVRGYGIRTTSTTAQYNTIPNMNAGTTAGLSVLYNAGYKVHLPLVNK